MVHCETYIENSIVYAYLADTNGGVITTGIKIFIWED